MAQEDVFKKLVSHCKEYGFVFPSSEIYDGLAAVYDYGQMGVELKNNIKKYWWDSMVLLHENIVGIDSAIFMHPTIWKASDSEILSMKNFSERPIQEFWNTKPNEMSCTLVMPKQ